jgi:putative restriction endonuclease
LKYFVGVTDNQWFKFLAALKPGEVNFWRPSGADSFKAIRPGCPFLFKLHSPDNFVVGGGFFLKHEQLPLSLAWDAFGEKNGAPDIDAFRNAVNKYRGTNDLDPVIGCTVLGDTFFLQPSEWIPIPRDWKPNIVRGKTYDSNAPIGAELWLRVSEAMLRVGDVPDEKLIREPPSEGFGAEYLTRARLGQGAFRVLVTSAYERRCAVTGERVLPVLQAAHIKPHARSGPNRVSNGILLKSDMHILFDRGFMTVTPDLKVQVSPAIRHRFQNGHIYYAFSGKALVQVPASADERPSGEFLAWHNENVYHE